MTNEELDKLSKLVAMTETCAKLGGTPMFTRIQRLVGEEIKAFLDEVDPEEASARPLAQPQRPRVTQTVVKTGKTTEETVTDEQRRV